MQAHHRRLAAFLDDGERVCGGGADEDELYIAPTVLRDVPPEANVMAEEIFGPILPVTPFDDFEECCASIAEDEPPLALYLFSEDRAHQRKLLESTRSGGLSVNEVINHLAVPGLPFGGLGGSGMGAYHGKHSFDTFSHRRAVLTRSTRPDFAFRYPPYSESDLRWLKRLFR